MSLFEELAKDVVTAVNGGDTHANMVQSVLGMLNNPATGGIAGLAQTFEQKGLGNLMTSWVGNGPNQPATPDQMNQVFGSEKLAELAQQAGIPPQAAAAVLAQVLPALIDRMTPGGEMPPAAGVSSSLVDSGMNFLKKSGIFGS